MKRTFKFYVALWQWVLHEATTAEMECYFLAPDYVATSAPKWDDC
jgi:hypothetical protein